MPDEKTAVLNGQRKYLEGTHEFTITDQTRLLAEGAIIMIYPNGQARPKWISEGTGEEGQPVKPGDRVQVYNAIVEFKK